MFSGYKCFDKGLVNRYGMQFEVGKTYHCDKKIKFGNDGHGFHVCKRLEDTLRYFDAKEGKVDICEVKCFGDYQEFEDDYNGYYEMYSYENIIIEKLLSHEEIIAYGLSLHPMHVIRFISLYKLTPEEIIMFKEKFNYDQNVLRYIAYYQEDDKNAFNYHQESPVKKRKL